MLFENIHWYIADKDLEHVMVDDEDMEADDFVNKITGTVIEWTSYPKDPNSIIFIYPVSYMNLGFSQLVQSVSYPKSSLPTGFEIFGAMATFYSKDMSEDQVPELFDGENENFRGHFRTLFAKNHPRHSFFKDITYFNGLEEVSPGVYYVHLAETDGYGNYKDFSDP